jgi:glycosyltransferase involved in cell wall biosynthesis
MSERSPSGRTLLLATSIPYWRRRRGSDQRIASLVSALVKAGWKVTTFYVNVANEALRESFDAGQFGELIEANEKLPPDYYVADPPLSRFTNHTLIQQFGRIARASRPDVVLIEYIELAYLADALPTDVRTNAVLAIDTHDVMHRRYERFAEVGRPHWVKISREEEAAALAPFDVVVAISEEDAAELSSMRPDGAVVTARHAVEMPEIARRNADGDVRFGFLGVGSQPNIDAAGYLLREVWPGVRERCSDCALTIAGEVCERVRYIAEGCEGVTLAGEVASLDAFYSRIDAVLNPVAFGGGLKIKNVEALAHACALVTTDVGAEGLGGEAGRGYLLASDRTQWVDHALAIAADTALRERLATNGRRLAEARFSPVSAYADFLDALTPTVAMRATA